MTSNMPYILDLNHRKMVNVGLLIPPVTIAAVVNVSAVLTTGL
jgi:hypothetical protein